MEERRVEPHLTSPVHTRTGPGCRRDPFYEDQNLTNWNPLVLALTLEGVNMSILACPDDLGNPAQKQTLIPHTCTPSTPHAQVVGH